MKKRSLLTMVIALCLVGAVGVGATLAYFTDKAEKENTVTMGHVDIDLYETSETGEETDNGYDFSNIVPGQTFDKRVFVKVNEGSEDCWVRVKVDITGFDFPAGEDDIAALLADVDNEVWEDGQDGYFYHKAVMSYEPNREVDEVLFNEITIPAERWDNRYADANFSISLKAEAVQAAYLDVTSCKDAFAKVGADNIQEYTPKTATTEDNEAEGED